ncbi:MAG: hypothetical protein LQ343_005223 [Gyalolechia ehrenbergii]|nr:MAG: hypothetical protein LQ343_005223 [Gyalolechia ehrenbergii]
MHQQVDVERMPSKKLAKTSKLNLLWDFVNYAYNDSVKCHPELDLEGNHKRLDKPEDFVEEMGPNGVAFIHYAPGSAKGPDSNANIIATAGCKPWSTTSNIEERVKRMRKEREAVEKGTSNRPGTSGEGFYTKANDSALLQQLEHVRSMTDNDEQVNVPQWEVTTVCVHPEWQKQGLAEKLLGLVIGEVSSQVKFQGKGPEFKLVVRTMKEFNEKYWLSKGFETVAEKFFGPGSFGSPIGFHMLDLTRDHHTN